MTVIYGIVLFLLIVFLLVILFLAIPVRYAFEMNTETDFWTVCKIYWGKEAIARLVLSYDKKRSFWYEIKVPGKRYTKKEEEQEEKQGELASPNQAVQEEVREREDLSVQQGEIPSKENTVTTHNEKENTTIAQAFPKELVKQLKPYLLSWETYLEGFTFLHRVYLHSKPREFMLKGQFGTGNPAQTGMMYGFFCSLWPERMIDIELEFLEPIYAFHTSLKGRVIPLVIAWYGMKFIMSKAIRPMIWIVVKGGFHGHNECKR